MSSIVMNIPTLTVNENDLENLLYFIYIHEKLLQEFGGFKVQLTGKCKLALKKRKFSHSPKNVQQIEKMNQNQLVYSIKLKTSQTQLDEESSLPIKDERLFWSNLSSNNNLENTTLDILYNTSFFYLKSNRRSFHIQSLPKQSLLKLGGVKLTKQFLPYLTRSYGSGAIIPLNSREKHLSSLIYHHEGGPRHYYIIPSNQRNNIRLLFLHESLSGCIDHSQLLIDPSLFDKYQVKYYKTIQHPNEFVILSSSCLSQSFDEYSNWTESIDFALPSWIEDGHAYHSCQCLIKSLYQFDLNLFRHEIIQRYISTNLNNKQIIKQQFSTFKGSAQANAVSKIILLNSEISSPNVENVPFRNLEPMISLNKISSTLDQFSPVLIDDTIDSSYFEQHEYINNGKPSFIEKETSFLNTSENNLSLTTPTESISQEYLFELPNSVENQFDQTYLINNLLENMVDNERIDNTLSALEDVINITTFTSSTSVSTYSQTDQSIDILEDRRSLQANLSSLVDKNISIKDVHNENRIDEEKLDRRKTLFVSGLQKNVKMKDIYCHFVGSIKVTLKNCQTASHLKYAFVVHRTSRDAEYNLLKPINHILFGRQCHVQYTNYHGHLSIRRQYTDRRKIVVNNIPENVSENDLQHVFGDCHLLKYCPGRFVRRTSTKTTTSDQTKLLWG